MLYEIADGLGKSVDDENSLYCCYRDLKLSRLIAKQVKFGHRWEELDQAMVDFLRLYSHYILGQADDEFYLAMFEPYRKYVTGDITPAYSTLDTQTVRHVHDVLPQAKVILVVRDPVSRLWSQLNMHARRNFRILYQRSPRVEADFELFDRLLRPEKLDELLHQDDFLSRLFATMTYQKWNEVFPSENILVVNFKDLTSKTSMVLEKLCRFLFVRLRRKPLIPNNRKGNVLKLKLDDSRKRMLESVLGDEVLEYVRIFDGHRDRI